MSRKGHVNRSNQPPSHPTTARYPVKGLNKKRVSIQNLRNKLALETFANVMFLREFRRLEWVRSQRKTKGPLRKHRSMDYKLSPQPLPSAVPSVTCSWCVRRIECVDVESDVHGPCPICSRTPCMRGARDWYQHLCAGTSLNP